MQNENEACNSESKYCHNWKALTDAGIVSWLFVSIYRNTWNRSPRLLLVQLCQTH